MPCARAEDALPSAAADMVSAALIQKAAGGGARRPAEPGRALQRTPHVSAGDVDAPAPAASCSGDDGKGNRGGRREESRRGRTRSYRSELEQEVKKLQRQLEKEIELHVALAEAVTQNAPPPALNSSAKIPPETQELLVNIASLEGAVSNLEKELNDLYYQLCHERNERLLAQNNPGGLPSASSDDRSLSTCTCTWEEHISSLRDLKFGGSESMRSMQQDLLTELDYDQDLGEESEDRQMVSLNRLLEKHRDVSLNGLLEKHRDEEMQGSCSVENQGKEDEKIDDLSFEQSIQKLTSMKAGNLWNYPNQLSEEMRSVYLVLHWHPSQIHPYYPQCYGALRLTPITMMR
uniref:Ternary complex factor MIP1 leucine-zipper domain-containing protein n=1 Tax=Triticum urartu TaxID=4572 RepID=A0A8R7UPL6_TRIUA